MFLLAKLVVFENRHRENNKTQSQQKNITCKL